MPERECPQQDEAEGEVSAAIITKASGSPRAGLAGCSELHSRRPVGSGLTSISFSHWIKKRV